MEKWDVYHENRNKTGKVYQRGDNAENGEYRLAVAAWIQNSNGEYLISKRSPGKIDAGKWQTTTGGVLAGENSKEAALREDYEELGITLDPKRGFIIHLDGPINIAGSATLFDVWFFKQDFFLDEVVLQAGETVAARYATEEEILKLHATGELIAYDYLAFAFELMRPQN